jgi:hypothetical protein
MSKSKTVDDVGGSTGFTGSGNFSDWGIRVGGIIFGNISND